MWIFLGGDVKVHSEDEVRPREVQVHGQSYLNYRGVRVEAKMFSLNEMTESPEFKGVQTSMY